MSPTTARKGISISTARSTSCRAICGLEPPPIGDFSWPEAGSTLPTVASPSFSYEPAYSDNHVREGDPKFDDPIPALSTPHELLVGVLPGVCALHDPAFCACQRSRFPFLGDPRDQATGL